MDMFMDKLAQKLTAQEMIKANMAADAEEMNRLKSKVKEYSECLEKVQMLVDDGVSKLEAAKVDGSEINRLVEQGIAKINDVKADEDKKSAEVIAILEEMEAKLKAALEDMEKQLEVKLEASQESVHKECVKVYRNVQAVLVEENSKQAAGLKEALDESLSATVKGYRGKLNAILGISIASLIVALGSLVVNILNMMNFKLF